MRKKLIPMAICYDFDGTLSPGNMQEYGFMRALKEKTPNAFWKESNGLAEANMADSIAAYMLLMLEKMSEKNIAPTRKAFQKFGSDIELYQGVEGWFERINKYAKEKGVLMHHYIISSGLKEMIEGTKIAKHFKAIFASTFMYDANGEAFWPAIMLNYTSKTQFLFRVNKGCEDVRDNETVNKYMCHDERPVPFEHMIYVGDGETDIPCMKMLKVSGGHSVAVYKNAKAAKKIAHLVADNRVNLLALADYRAGKELDTYVKSLIDKVVADFTVKSQEKQ